MQWFLDPPAEGDGHTEQLWVLGKLLLCVCVMVSGVCVGEGGGVGWYVYQGGHIRVRY